MIYAPGSIVVQPLHPETKTVVSPALLQRRDVARRVEQAFGGHSEVSAILVFGSVAVGLSDERSDVDVLVLSRSSVVPLAQRQQILAPLGALWQFHRGTDANRLFADQDVGGRISGVPVEIAYQTVEWIDDVLDDVLVRGAITTTRMPFRPYTLPALLQRSWVLRDTDDVIAAWRERAREYPGPLKVNIFRHFVPELRDYTDELVSSAERGLGPGVFVYFLHHAWDALRSVLLALNGVYDPADKRMDQAVLPTLHQVPCNFLSRVADVLIGPFDASGAMKRARLFERLTTDTLALLPAEMDDLVSVAPPDGNHVG